MASEGCCLPWIHPLPRELGSSLWAKTVLDSRRSSDGTALLDPFTDLSSTCPSPRALHEKVRIVNGLAPSCPLPCRGPGGVLSGRHHRARRGPGARGHELTTECGITGLAERQARPRGRSSAKNGAAPVRQGAMGSSGSLDSFHPVKLVRSGSAGEPVGEPDSRDMASQRRREVPRISPKGRMGDAVRILIADDHPLTRDGIKAALAMDPGLKVIAEAADGQEAVSLAASERPDVVLMDVRMPRLGGIRATQEIMRVVPGTRVVILTVEETQARVGEAIQAGAVGYLLKDIDARELARAVHLAAQGSAVIHPNLTRQFIEEIRQLTRGEQTVASLSAREVEVLQMIAYGSTNREVADALHISPQTVKTYLERIFTKLGVSDRTRAVAVALKHGIVE